MNLLKKIRIILLLVTVILYQSLILKRIFHPLTLLITLQLIIFFIELKKSCKITKLLDIIISAAYLIFINPLWISVFIIIHGMCIIKQDEKSLKFHLLLLTILSIIATYSRLLITSNFVSMLLILPSIIALGFLFKIFFKKGWNNLEENNHLNTLLSNKNKILSTLTHELRTPLTVIKTSNELILEGRSGEITDLQRSLLTSSLENTIRLISLAENILSQIKVEFSWFTMKKQILDIKTLIRKVTTDMTPFLEAKKIHLHYSYPALLSKSIGDKRWIQQVILNLIHNSSKNIQEDSEIEINVKENEQCIVISVHDYGMGIKNKEISHVFNEFYQSTDPVKDLTNGTGLGLTIVKNIIEKHGGNVYISSMHGLGTTVSFTLPIYRGVISEIFSPNN